METIEQVAGAIRMYESEINKTDMHIRMLQKRLGQYIDKKEMLEKQLLTEMERIKYDQNTRI